MLCAGLGLSLGCDSTETEPPSEPVAQKPEPKPDPKVDPKVDPQPEPQPEPEPVLATVAVSSIYLMNDCPHLDPKPDEDTSQAKPSAIEPPAQDAPSPGAMARSVPKGDTADGLTRQRRACSQSTMQLTFTGQGDASSKAKIVSVNLYSSGDVDLGTLESRVPMVWRDDGYVIWDETIPAKTDLKASYRLATNGKLNAGPGGGGTYYVEVVVDIDGKTQKVRSPEFTREMEHNIVT